MSLAYESARWSLAIWPFMARRTRKRIGPEKFIPQGQVINQPFIYDSSRNVLRLELAGSDIGIKRNPFGLPPN